MGSCTLTKVATMSQFDYDTLAWLGFLGGQGNKATKMTAPYQNCFFKKLSQCEYGLKQFYLYSL